LKETDSILHDLINQLVSVSIPSDTMHREEHIRNLTPIINVSEGASAPNEPEGTFILGKLKPKDAETTIFDDLMKPVTCKELYPFYMDLPQKEFVIRLNKTLYDYVRQQLEQAKANHVHDSDNIWMQPNAEFFNYFQEQGIDIDSVSPLLQNTEVEEVVNDSIDNNAEHRVAVKKIKQLRNENKALKLHTGKPSRMAMKVIIDKNRFKSNDIANCTNIGKEIGRDPETAKRWIQKLGLSDYAFNPKHLK